MLVFVNVTADLILLAIDSLLLARSQMATVRPTVGASLPVQ
jgi:hypothetical protein